MKNLFFKKILLTAVLTVAVGLIGCGSDKTATTPEKVAPVQAKTETTPIPIAKVTPAPAPEKTPQPKQAARWKPEPTAAPVEAADTASSYTTKRTAFVEKHGLPEKYKDLKNPLAPTTENLTAGGVFFRTRCALCHGNKGKGDGIAGAALKPPASDLSRVAAMALATDGYIFWTITEGGGALKTAMPTFNIMPEDERWQIVLFVKKEIAGR